MPTTRQSMRDVLTAAQAAFVHQPENGATQSHPHETDRTPAPENEVDHPARARRPNRKDARPRTEAGRNAIAARRREPLRSVTLRLPASLAEALRRVSIQRSLNYVEPFSQQAIVETALRRWLELEEIEG